MNLKIHRLLVEKAQAVFSTLTLPTGTYTATQVDDLLPTIPASDFKALEQQQLTVTLGTFSCTASASSIFSVLRQFETAMSIPSKKRARFNTCTEAATTPVLRTVTFTFTRDMAHMARYTSTDQLRSILGCIFVDTEAHTLVSSDGHILAAHPVPDIEVTTNPLPENTTLPPIVIPAKVFRSLPPGTVRITQQGKDTLVDTLIHPADGTIHKVGNTSLGRYPNWESVVRSTTDLTIRLTPEAVKSFKKEVSTLCANRDNRHLSLSARSSSLFLSIYENYFTPTEEKPLSPCVKSSSFTLTPSRHSIPDFTLTASLSYLKMLPPAWDGTIHIVSHLHLIFPLTSGAYLLLLQSSTPDGWPPFHLAEKHPSPFTRRPSIPSSQSSTSSLSSQSSSSSKSSPSSKSSSSSKSIPSSPSTPITLLIPTAMNKKTPTFYTLTAIEAGNYTISDPQSDPELRLFLRTAAHYYTQRPPLQPLLCKHFNDSFSKQDWRSLYPLSEQHLATLINQHLESLHIDEIPDYLPALKEYEATLSSSPSSPSSKSRTSSPSSPSSPSSQSSPSLVPILQLDTSEGPLTIAGESYFDELYDPLTDTFRSPQAEQQFSDIDAFIPDRLVLAATPDYEAIATAVEQYFSLLETA